jgi:hypothetical protein
MIITYAELRQSPSIGIVKGKHRGPVPSLHSLPLFFPLLLNARRGQPNAEAASAIDEGLMLPCVVALHLVMEKHPQTP